MGKTIVVYDVFIACPGDVKEERQIVHDVCRDLNNDILVDNIQFKAIDWEDALPGILSCLTPFS